MYLTDYSMVNEGTDDEDCEMRQIRFAKKDLVGAIVKSVKNDEIVIELTQGRPGDLVHITPSDSGFGYSTLEGGTE